MSVTPLFYGRGAGAYDPFSLDAFDPFFGGNTFTASSYTFPAPPSAVHRGGELPSFVRAAALMDWKETPEAHVFEADLPGVNKAGVKVEVLDGRVLQISGARTRERKGKNDSWYCIERGRGRFLRRFILPGNAKVDQVTAAMENGVLTVTVPKGAAAGRPGVGSVEISG